MASDEVRRAALDYLKRAIDLQNESTAEIQHAGDVLQGMGGEGAKREKVGLVSPVTGQRGTAANPFGGDWFDATGFGTYYNATGKWAYHTGCDLNLPNLADAGKPVYAVADGDILFSSTVPGWQGLVVVIRIELEEGAQRWLRYAHVAKTLGLGPVKQGQVIGYVADYNADGPKGDHLHFDVAAIDLSLKPGDWPGADRARLVRDYLDPQAWLRERLA